MRDNLWGWNPVPEGWKPYVEPSDPSKLARTSTTQHIVSNPTNPGYAYGTIMPNNARAGVQGKILPMQLPVAATFSNLLPVKPQIQGVAPNYARGMYVGGLQGSVPSSGLDAMTASLIQAKLANAQV